MNIYLRIVAAITFTAFTLIKKANFKLDADNIGILALSVAVALIYKFIMKTGSIPDFGRLLQSALMSS